jgi:hypothetical protein
VHHQRCHLSRMVHLDDVGHTNIATPQEHDGVDKVTRPLCRRGRIPTLVAPPRSSGRRRSARAVTSFFR